MRQDGRLKRQRHRGYEVSAYTLRVGNRRQQRPQTIRSLTLPERLSGPGGTSLTMNPIINVHRVPTGREGAVRREVANAIRDPLSQGIDQLRKMPHYASRLGYV
jgi:hypothetical protein